MIASTYAWTNRAWAEWLAWHIEAFDYSVAIPAWDLRPGHNEILERDRAIKADRTLLVLSPAALASPFLQAEWAAAFRKGPTLLGAHQS